MTTQEDRTIDVFVTDLRRRAEHCDFGALKDSLIRDQIAEQSKEQSKVFDSPTAQASSIHTVKKTRVPVETEKTDDVKRIVKCKFDYPLTTEEAARPMEQRVTNVMGEITMRGAA